MTAKKSGSFHLDIEALVLLLSYLDKNYWYYDANFGLDNILRKPELNSALIFDNFYNPISFPNFNN